MAKRRVDLLLLDSAQTVPVKGSLENQDLGIIDNGGVAIEKGRIVQVASSPLIEKKYFSANIIRLNDEIILPGFVDPHSHLVFAGSREEEFQNRIRGISYLENLKKGKGIHETVSKTRQASRNELVSVARMRLDTMLENGTTAVEVKSGYGLSTYEEMKILQVINELRETFPAHIIPTFLGAHAIPIEFTQDEYSTLIIDEMLPLVARSNLAAYCDVFCEHGAFDLKTTERILRAGLRMGLQAKLHADQFSDNGGAKLASKLRAVSADHMVYSPISCFQKLKITSVVPVILPASSDSLLSPIFAPALQMLSEGLPVALGTDFSPSNWTLSMLSVAAIAARRMRMQAEDLVRAITINAARAVGLQHEIGSLEPGKAADIAILAVPNYKLLGYSRGEGLVDKVLIGGKLVINNGWRVVQSNKELHLMSP